LLAFQRFRYAWVRKAFLSHPALRQPWGPRRRIPVRAPRHVRAERMAVRAEASGSAQDEHARSRATL